MENNSPEVTEIKKTTSNSKDKSNSSNYHNPNNNRVGGSFGGCILGVGALITGFEAYNNGIPSNFQELFNGNYDMLTMGLGATVLGMGALYLGGYSPIEGVLELIGELTLLPYRASKKAYQKHKKIKRAKNIRAIRTSKLERAAVT